MVGVMDATRPQDLKHQSSEGREMEKTWGCLCDPTRLPAPPPWSSGLACNPSLWPPGALQTLYLDSGRYSGLPLPRGPGRLLPRAAEQGRRQEYFTLVDSETFQTFLIKFSEEPRMKQREKGSGFCWNACSSGWP